MNIQDINTLIVKALGHDPDKIRNVNLRAEAGSIPTAHIEEMITDLDLTWLMYIIDQARTEGMESQIKTNRERERDLRKEVDRQHGYIQELVDKVYKLENPPKPKRKKKKAKK